MLTFIIIIIALAFIVSALNNSGSFKIPKKRSSESSTTNRYIKQTQEPEINKTLQKQHTTLIDSSSHNTDNIASSSLPILPEKNENKDYVSSNLGTIKLSPKNLEDIYESLLAPPQIRPDVLKRNIPYLIHFTQIDNLPSIIKNGLMTKSRLNNLKIKHAYNDPLRLDNRISSISLSISFPNSSLFYRWRKSDPNKKWVVLLLDPSILYRLPCLFFKDNAASSAMKNQSDKFSQSFQAYSSMFEGQDPYSKFPTNIQAEVLCTRSIAPDYIRGIATDNPLCSLRVSSVLKQYDLTNIPVKEAPYYFGKHPSMYH